MDIQAESKILSELGYKQELSRAFNLWQLTAYGLNYMIPIAPAIVFGFVIKKSGGTVALPYLFAFLGTLFTACGYSYFIKRYPLAGSVYSYVSKSMGSHIGFISGWAILLDYIVIPTLTAMSASMYLHSLMPGITYEHILIFFIASTGSINLIGSDPLAKLGLVMLLVGEVVIFIAFFFWAKAVHSGIGVGHLFSLEPFRFSNFAALTSATSIAMLSYLGFDAITTLAEEAKNPTKDIPRAIFLSLIIGTVTMFLTGYLGALMVPDWHNFINDNNWFSTALFFVSKRAGGNALVLFYTIGFVVAMAVFNVAATTGASRVLFGISRDKIAPLGFLSLISKRRKVPLNAIVLIIAVQVLVGSFCRLDNITEVVNFGALFGFFIINVSFFIHMVRFDVIEGWRIFVLTIPVFGALINFWILIHLGDIALLSGGAWVLIGVVIVLANARKKSEFKIN